MGHQIPEMMSSHCVCYPVGTTYIAPTVLCVLHKYCMAYCYIVLYHNIMYLSSIHFHLHKSVLSLSPSPSAQQQQQQQQQQHGAKEDYLDMLNDRIESLEELVFGLKEEVSWWGCVVGLKEEVSGGVV